jgi:cyclopropane fatty-acyl-phospholipid synthase-like methyltransferase
MKSTEPSVERAPLSHFERLYSESADPWDYATSDYEQRKYRATLDALHGATGRTLELGCSIGVFSAMLAPQCNSLVAVDFSPTALAEARRRLAGAGNVEIVQATLPEQTPPGPFDAIVCSELLYYWSPTIVREGLTRIEAALAEGGTLVAVHWLGRDPRPELDGDRVHEILRESCKLRHETVERGTDYVLDVWRKQ